MKKAVSNELRDIMGIFEEPEMVRIYRWNKAITQYSLGHDAILRDIEDTLSKIHGLHLTGNAYQGIGVSECIINSERLAQKLINNSRMSLNLPYS